VNLNFSASRAAFDSAIEQGGLRTVISSRAFLKRLEGFDAPKGTIYIEDLAGEVHAFRKVEAWIRARLAPRWSFPAFRTFHPDQTATIIFSSGTTGVPKGVVLSHYNIQSNIDGFSVLLGPRPDDNICSALPFFHSFGFTCGLWLPATAGFVASYHANPMDGSAIARVVREHRSTLLVTTPTFLQIYLRRAKTKDFGTLRLIITGAEKLRPSLADAFEGKFGLRPMEGYGATELAPVVSINVSDAGSGAASQAGHKNGSVGQPVPGVAVRVVDVETGEELGPGESGLLLVKGPNVMTGYLDLPERTSEAVRDGWYNTGDLAQVDAEGFVTITDRLARFSKIGGEMVPHRAVEEVYYDRLDLPEHSLAVTAVPDEKKGERLAVLYTAEAGTVERLADTMKASDLPNLWRPAPGTYVPVESLPLLGSGKLDLFGIKQRALEVLGG